jgi:hypothetical protein
MATSCPLTFRWAFSRTGEIAVWLLNFANEKPAEVTLRFTNVQGKQRVMRLTLGNLKGTTTAPKHDVDWSTSDLAGVDLNHVKVDAPAATISVVALGGGG